jgi:hypothetical protein
MFTERSKAVARKFRKLAGMKGRRAGGFSAEWISWRLGCSVTADIVKH